jgi:hypothetical protein
MGREKSKAINVKSMKAENETKGVFIADDKSREKSFVEVKRTT